MNINKVYFFFSCNLSKGQIKPKSRSVSRRFSQRNERTNLICLPCRVKKQTKQIVPFVFWEKLADHKLLSRLADLYHSDNYVSCVLDYYRTRVTINNISVILVRRYEVIYFIVFQISSSNLILVETVGSSLLRPVFKFLIRDHPYNTSAKFWTFSDPPTHF